MVLKNYSFLGIEVQDFTEALLKQVVEKEIKENKKIIIGHHNLHSLHIYHKNEKMRQYFKLTSYTYIDGMAIVMLGKILGIPLNSKNRLTSLDWLMSVLNMCAQNKYRMFFLGSKPGIPEISVKNILAKIPNLEVKTHHGFFDANGSSSENAEVLKLINDYNPNIVMVGMGMPRQEIWITENIDRINSNIIWSLGAFMDYFAAVIPTPPRWMGRIGLEWLYRLCSEPQRLWKRYLIEPWFIVRLLIAERLFRRKREVQN